MEFDKTQASTDPKTTRPDVATAPAATSVPAGGYDAQRAALKPAGASKDASPKFDMWKLTPEVQALFTQLGKIEDPKAVEPILNSLVKDHGVPKDVVQGVIASNQSFFGKVQGAIKSGSWHTVSTDEKGNPTLEFKADGKGIGWDAAAWSLQGDINGKSLTYTDKDDGWKAQAAYDDRGKVTVTKGTDPKDQSAYHVEGGKDGGGASYRRVESGTTTKASGDVTVKDGNGTATANYSRATETTSTDVAGHGYWGDKVGGDVAFASKDGDKTRAANGSFIRKGDQNTAMAGVTIGDKGKSTSVTGTALVGPQTGGSVKAVRTKGEKSTTLNGSIVKEAGQNTASAGVTRTEKDKSTSVKGTALFGPKTGGSAAVVRTEGEKSTAVNGSFVNEAGQNTATAGMTQSSKDATTSVAGTAWAGPKTGGKVDATVDRKGYKVDGSVDASRTRSDTETVTEAGASGTFTKKAGTNDAGEKNGDDVVVTVNARGKKTQSQGGDQATNLKLGGSVASGSTSADATYETEGGQKGGQSYRFHDVTTNFGKTWDLDSKLKEGFKLNLGGHLRLSDVKGEDVAATGDLRGTWYKGDGDGKKELTFRLFGGQDQLSTFSNLAHTTPGMLGDAKGTGQFGHLATQYKGDGYTLNGDATLGHTNDVTLGGAHLGAAKDDVWKLDAYASFAKRDSGTATMFRMNGEFAATSNLKLDAGGSYSFTPGTPEHQKLWEIHAGAGYQIDNKQSLTLRMGVAGDGSQLYYVPEIMYKHDGKFTASAMAVLGRQGTNSVGAKLKLDKPDITFFAGYGNAQHMMNPYAGNAGMAMPNMGSSDVMGRGNGQAGGFVGVQWNALPTLQKLFGGK